MRNYDLSVIYLSESENQDFMRCDWNAGWKRHWYQSWQANKMHEEETLQHTWHAEELRQWHQLWLANTSKMHEGAASCCAQQMGFNYVHMTIVVM